MTPEDRDRLIEAAEELKRQRARETCLRVVVTFQGREWAPRRSMRSRYFLVNVPKDWGDFTNPFERANNYVTNSWRFPLFYEMVMSDRYESAHVSQILSDEDGDCVEIT